MSNEEQKRAERISFMTDGIYDDTAKLYESLVDREYAPAKEKAKSMIRDLRMIIKLIDDADF
jgi:hypothetical protein